MLDFYLISDEDEMWDEPLEAFRIGAFSLEEWKSLSNLLTAFENNGILLSYFQDTRIDSKQVTVAIKLIEEYDRQKNVDPVRKNFKEMICKALIQGKGIISFCD